MAHYTVKITSTDGVRIYTTEANSAQDAANNAGLAYRFAGNDTDNIKEIIVKKI